jgi:hypothetical protein
MLTYSDTTRAIAQLPTEGNTYFTRMVVRIDGLDYDIQNITLNTDGVLGEYIVLHTVPLEV